MLDVKYNIDFSIFGGDALLNRPYDIEDIVSNFEKTHDADVYMFYHMFPGEIEFKLRNGVWSTAAHVPYEKVTKESIISALDALYEELQRKENRQT